MMLFVLFQPSLSNQLLLSSELYVGFPDASVHDLGHTGLAEEPVRPVHAVLSTLPLYHLTVDCARGRADEDHGIETW